MVGTRVFPDARGRSRDRSIVGARRTHEDYMNSIRIWLEAEDRGGPASFQPIDYNEFQRAYNDRQRRRPKDKLPRGRAFRTGSR